jgi:hypothetical protein
MTRTYELIFRLINEGGITVGEARQALEHCWLDRESRELLAGWVMDRADQGEDWRAGDPIVIECGCRISYDHEQVDTRCDGPACLLDRYLLVPLS